jgi:hypothetical protein
MAWSWKLFSLLFFGVAASCMASEPIRAIDADEKEVILNHPDRITVIIYSNQALQEKTRAAGKALYPYQGIPNFRVIVLVDLRDSFAHFVKGYTVRRMRKDLDEEAVRVRPFYQKNGNMEDPRDYLSAVPDFDGTICKKIEWNQPSKTLRVKVYGKDGTEILSWDNLRDPIILTEAIGELLK